MSTFFFHTGNKSKKSHLISIIPYEERYFTSLLHMYDTYSPLGSVQGLPPLDKTKRHQWVQDMISRGTNLLALYRDTVIGQASLFSMPVSWAEYLSLYIKIFRGRASVPP